MSLVPLLIFWPPSLLSYSHSSPCLQFSFSPFRSRLIAAAFVLLLSFWSFRPPVVPLFFSDRHAPLVSPAFSPFYRSGTVGPSCDPFYPDPVSALFLGSTSPTRHFCSPPFLEKLFLFPGFPAPPPSVCQDPILPPRCSQVTLFVVWVSPVRPYSKLPGSLLTVPFPIPPTSVPIFSFSVQYRQFFSVVPLLFFQVFLLTGPPPRSLCFPPSLCILFFTAFFCVRTAQTREISPPPRGSQATGRLHRALLV